MNTRGFIINKFIFDAKLDIPAEHNCSLIEKINMHNMI